MILLYLIFLSSLYGVFSIENKEYLNNNTNTKENIFALKECKNEYSELCFKIDIINLIEKISKTNEIKILQSLSIVKENLFNDTNSEDMVSGN